ncbi:MAG: NapC/NirT family cytochrome c [Pelosinus sp.]|nr:NapC/NirT family cytochrome c [Pelosinus sp.]
MDTGQYFNRRNFTVAAVVLAAAAVLVAFAGGGYAYADSTAFCGNTCHSMKQAHATWQTSNHKELKCTECHLPHGNIVQTMIMKAKTGMHDTYHEVLKDYPAAIQLSAEGKTIVKDNCLRCHKSTVEKTGMAAGGEECQKCHRSLVHGANKTKGGIKIE